MQPLQLVLTILQKWSGICMLKGIKGSERDLMHYNDS